MLRKLFSRLFPKKITVEELQELFGQTEDKRQLSKEEIKELLLLSVENQLVLSPIEYNPNIFSKIGGKAYLPKGFAWPTYCDDIELDFVMQIDLEEIAEYDIEKKLPSKGVLSFFYDSYNKPQGYYDDDVGGLQVHYFADKGELEKREGSTLFFNEYSLECKSKNMVLTPEDFADIFGEFRLENEDMEQAYEELSLVPNSHDECSLCYPCDFSMFGIISAIQHCWPNNLGYVLRNRTEENDSANTDVDFLFKNWVPLLQIPSNDELRSLFHDDGYINVYIKREDLKNQNFENIAFATDVY